MARDLADLRQDLDPGLREERRRPIERVETVRPLAPSRRKKAWPRSHETTSLGPPRGGRRAGSAV